MEEFGDFGDENQGNGSTVNFDLSTTQQDPFLVPGEGMTMQSQQPAFNAMGSPIKQDNDLTPEEQEQVAQVMAEQQERTKALYDKQMDEEKLK